MAGRDDGEDGPVILAMFTGPGPAKYSMGTTVGTNSDPRVKKGSSYSIAGPRKSDLVTNRSPGPIYQTSKTLVKQTSATSIKAPHKELSKLNVPGPGTYQPQTSATSGQRKAAAYSLKGTFGPDKKTYEKNPGPQYALPSTIGDKVPDKKGGSSVMLKSGRHNGLNSYTYDAAKTPGPAAHGAVKPQGKTAGSSSIKGRSYPPSPKVVSPGPVYDTASKTAKPGRTSPSVSMGKKHSKYIHQCMV